MSIGLQIEANSMPSAGSESLVEDTNGTNSALSLSQGRVGIGTTGPGSKLEVKGDSDDLALKVVENNDTEMFSVRDDVDIHNNNATHLLSNGGKIVVIPQGTDGLNIKEAIDNLGSDGGIVYLPTGTYNISSTDEVEIPANVELVGAGIKGTIINAETNATNFDVLTITGDRAAIRNMSFQSADSANRRHTAIKVMGIECNIENVLIESFNFGILCLMNCNEFKNYYITDCNTGIQLGNVVSTGSITNIAGTPAVVTGNAGVDWATCGDSKVRAASWFKLDADSAWVMIDTVDSDTQLTLNNAYSGGTSGSYKIFQEANANVFLSGLVQSCHNYGIRCYAGWGNSFHGVTSERHTASGAIGVSLEDELDVHDVTSQSLFGCFLENCNEKILKIDSRGNKVIGCWFVKNTNDATMDGDFIGWTSGSGESDGNQFLGNTRYDLVAGTKTYDDVNLGRVGIGTTSPNSKLTIQGGADESADLFNVNNANGNVIGRIYQAGGNDGVLQVLNNAGNVRIQLYSHGDSWLAGGNVGIGTNGPTVKLDVNTIADDNHCYLALNAPSGKQSAISFRKASTQKWTIYCSESDDLRFWSGDDRIVIATDGKMGLGTSPTQQLDVKGRITVSPTGINPDGGYNGNLVITKGESTGQYINLMRSGNYPWSIGTVYNSNNFAIGTGQGTDSNFTAPEFVIAVGGNVGVGVTNPASKLSVDGGDIEVEDSAKGLILRDANDSDKRYRIRILNGALSISAV
jgi:hypothetical protein